MTQTLSLGPLSLLAEQHGPLLTITIHAPSDTAPVGRMTLTVAEWTSLVALVDCMGAADRRIAELTRERDELDDGARLLDKVRALVKSNEELRAKLGNLDSGASMPLAAALKSATPGPVHVEPDSSYGDRPGVFRIVTDEAERRFRDEYQTTARPPYVATVYSAGDADLYKLAHNVLPRLIDHHRSVLADIDSLRQQVRELTEERDRLRNNPATDGCVTCEIDHRRVLLDQLIADRDAALVSVDAMAERIEQMRPVYERAVEWRDALGSDAPTRHDTYCKLMTAIDTALAHTAREEAKESK
jgi:hypothetical protein